jgi:hypothetical protein
LARIYPLSLRERVRVRGKAGLPVHCCPLIRPSATFSPGEKGQAIALSLQMINAARSEISDTAYDGFLDSEKSSF